MLVVTSEEHRENASSGLTFRLEDSCAHCAEPISVEIENGSITHVSPERPFVQQGGG